MSPPLVEETPIVPVKDAAKAVALSAQCADELAAAIVGPVSFSSGGGVPADPSFLRVSRRVTKNHRIALIFDEVLCAVQLGLGGKPVSTGEVPDLVTIGKAVSVGLPLGAFRGSAELMEADVRLDEGTRRIVQSGKFTENSVSGAAGAAVLANLEESDALTRDDHAGERLQPGLVEIFAERGHEAAVAGSARSSRSTWM